jgi:pimeloyl-ACP methyl ester carboxylesterase
VSTATPASAAIPAMVMYRPGLALGLRDATFVAESFASAFAAATAPTTSWDRVRAGEPGVPLLLLFGAGDPACAVSAADLAADVPLATGIDLPDAGHLSILDQPAAVAAALIDFLGVRR